MTNMLGAYGPWAAGLLTDPPRLSWRRGEFRDLARWRQQARARYRELLAQPNTGGLPKATVQHQLEYDGLTIEHLSWQLPYGPPTEGLFLRPAKAKGPLPAILGLHDHGGNKYFGYRKITRMSGEMHPLMVKHQEHYYGGLAWANEIAKRGYAVLVHDTFLFASRRVRPRDLPPQILGGFAEVNPEDPAEIEKYNRFAAAHESVVAKSLFCAGTTWPGIFVGDDQRALDYLASRPEVDAKRLGCCGLSGGGLRTVFLTGADERIRASCCVGMMSTWRDYLLHKSYTHTWMCYVPLLARDLDYPEVMALSVPNPMLVLNNRQDQLFTMPEMERAGTIVADVYRKAGAEAKQKTSFYDGPHKFDRAMQNEAFAWFDQHLK